jgi:hypothetical protein
VIVRSRVGYFYGHWDSEARRSRRCCDYGCEFCQRGATKRTFAYIWVELFDGDTRVMELSGRHAELAVELHDRGVGAVGQVLYVEKTGTAKNSPISIMQGETEPCEELDIWGFVNTLGLPAKVVGLESRLTGS